MLKSYCLDIMKNNSCIISGGTNESHVLRISSYCTHELQQPCRSTAHKQLWSPDFSFFLFFFHLTYSRWTSYYHPACGHKGSSHLSPVHALRFFYRDASSALLQLVNQWLNFTYSRSHAFRYERKDTNPTLVRIKLTTSVLLADVQLTY